MSITKNILAAFKKEFTMKMAYSVNPDVNKTSVRARIYENIGVYFDKIGKGLYIAKQNNGDYDEQIMLIEGDGRNLSDIENESIDAIVTDHPWSDPKANRGGNRHFATYNCFEYTQEDFNEKARVLKPGSFLVEMLPAENATNYEYLYRIKKMAENAGFKYYSKVPWKKGNFVSNTGRKAKNTEDMMIFSKGEPRELRLDAKKTKNTGVESYMKGTNGMLPTCFDVPPVPKKDIISQSEKPVELLVQILNYITKENEIVLDQFAGSGVTGAAAKLTNRLAVLIEQDKEKCKAIAKRLNLNPVEYPMFVSAFA